MNQLNTLIIEGNLAQDPTTSTLTQKDLCTFSIATNRSYKVKEVIHEEVTFIQVETWGSLAKNCAEYLKKGRPVRVVGRIKQNRWKDTEGNPRERHLVVAEHVDFLSYSSQRDRNEDDTESSQEEVDTSKTIEQSTEAVAEASKVDVLPEAKGNASKGGRKQAAL